MNKQHENMKNAALIACLGTAESAESRREFAWASMRCLENAKTQRFAKELQRPMVEKTAERAESRREFARARMRCLENAKTQRFAKELQRTVEATALLSEGTAERAENRREMKTTVGKSKKGKQNAATQNCYLLPATCYLKSSQLSTSNSPLSTKKAKQNPNRHRFSFIFHPSSFILTVTDFPSSLKALAFTLILALTLSLQAQEVPTPAPPHKAALLLENATLHIGDGTPAIKGNILVVNDKIQAVGITDLLPQDVVRIDLTGKHVYPGLIAPISQLGLSEIEAARATDDRSEVGPINPNARAITSYNTDSRVTPTVRSNGILLAQITPEGGLLKGLSSVVQLDAWSWEDAAYLTDDAMHLEWPSQQISVFPGSPPREEQEKRLKERMQQIEGAMRDAKGYATAKAAGKVAQIDLRWEAMVPIVNREKAIWINADAEKDIRTAIEFSQRHNLRMVLVGGADAWLLSDMLRLYQIPVVLRKPHSLPRTEDDPVDQPFNNARILYKAGVLTCLSMDNFWNYRNLPFQAGQTVTAGLTKEEALQLITANTAKILGIDARTGTLAAGKDANIIVSTGDLLDMRTNNIELALIQGRKIDLGNKQKDLNAKFSGKYGK